MEYQLYLSIVYNTDSRNSERDNSQSVQIDSIEEDLGEIVVSEEVLPPDISNERENVYNANLSGHDYYIDSDTLIVSEEIVTDTVVFVDPEW